MEQNYEAKILPEMRVVNRQSVPAGKAGLIVNKIEVLSLKPYASSLQIHRTNSGCRADRVYFQDDTAR